MRSIYKIVFFISVALTVVAIVLVVIFGLRLGVDFLGGAVMEIDFEKNRPGVGELNSLAAGISGVQSISSSHLGEREAILRLNDINETSHQEILAALRDKFGRVTENKFDSIGPAIGKELKNKSITAIIVLLFAVVIYIAFVFRKLSSVLSPWAMGAAAVAAMIHDVLIPMGLFAYLGHFYGIEITAVFVAGALTILGYSISDSVVVFDRVRENVIRFEKSENFGNLVHKSILQTLVRSINTTLTTVLALGAIFFFGGESIKYFALALAVGIISGSYSSIFVASPILVWMSKPPHQTSTGGKASKSQ